MKLFFQFIIILGILYSKTINIGFNSESEFSSANVSSLWLSKTPSIDPMSKNRLMFQYSYSFTRGDYQNNYWKWPNIDFGIKVTKNLNITAKVFGFSSNNESPQVLGSGMQYYYGNGDTLNWVTSIQRVDIKGLKDFNLTSLTFDIRKWINWKTFQIRFGIGSNFYKQSYFQHSMDNLLNTNGQINYLGLDAIAIYSIIKLGFNIQAHPNRIISSIFVQKEIF